MYIMHLDLLINIKLINYYFISKTISNTKVTVWFSKTKTYSGKGF